MKSNSFRVAVICLCFICILIPLKSFTQCTSSELGTIVDNNLGGSATRTNGAYSVSVNGNNAYVVSKRDDSLSVFDISNPAAITELGFILDDNMTGGTATQLNGAEGIFAVGTIVYVTSITDDSLSIFDVSNPAAITELGTIVDDNLGGSATQLENPSTVFVSGSTAYVASRGDDSLSAFDVSNPAMITELGTIVDNNKGGSATRINGARSVFIDGNNAYVTSAEDSLSVFDVSNPAMITELGFIVDNGMGGSATLLDNARSVFVVGNIAYVVSFNDDSLSTFDVSNPAAITEIGTIADDNMGGLATRLDGPESIYVNGGKAYVASAEDDSLSVFDVSNPAMITEIETIFDDNLGGTATRLDRPRGLFVHETKAYVASFDEDGLSIFDVNCPSTSSSVESPRRKVSAPVITSPKNGDTLNTLTPTISGTVNGSVNVRLIYMGAILLGQTTSTITNGGNGEFSFTLNRPLEEGTHTIEAFVDDVINFSDRSKPINFTIDSFSFTPDSTPTPSPSPTPSITPEKKEFVIINKR